MLDRIRTGIEHSLLAERVAEWAYEDGCLASPETPVGDSLVAEVLIERNQVALAFDVATRALRKHPGDWRLRQERAHSRRYWRSPPPPPQARAQ